MTRRLVVVGDTLLDRDVTGRVDRVCPDAPVPVLDEAATRSRPGGAGLAAVLAAADGRPVTLVTALAHDRAGDELRRLLAAADVRVVDLGTAGGTAEKIRLRAEGQSLLRLDRGGPPGPVGPPPMELAGELARAGAVLVADYGRGVTARPELRAQLEATRRPLVWDPHPRSGAPVPGATVATPNRAELVAFSGGGPLETTASVVARARQLRRRWRAAALAVTLGAEGAVVVGGDGPPLWAPAPPVTAVDVCGAGDRFAAGCAVHLADGAVPSEAVVAAVGEAAAWVAGDPGGADPGATGDARALAASVRHGGGTVVAAGGCFDLLHAGHVRLLRSARALGDCLVVCLNSDASVRRLKGAPRPLVPAEDRRAVLEALGCVDGVVVFDEDTPAAALRALRPHTFVKGGDYTGARLPEEEVMAEWGGQVVVLPYLDGRSTSGLVRRAAAPAP